VDPHSQTYIERVDEAIYRAQEVVEELAAHEPEAIEPIAAMLLVIAEAEDPGERIFRAWRAHPPLPEEHSPGAEIASDAFTALRQVAERCLDCFAVTRYVVQRQSGPSHEEETFSWRRIKPGGIVIDDIFFLNAPVHERLDSRGPVAVFGVKLTGGPALPILVDSRTHKHSLEDSRFWFAAYESLLGTPPAGVTLRMTQTDKSDVELASVDWTTLDRLWRPPSLPEGARQGPHSLPPVSSRPSSIPPPQASSNPRPSSHPSSRPAPPPPSLLTPGSHKRR
jgi:hypothetical protein